LCFDFDESNAVNSIFKSSGNINASGNNAIIGLLQFFFTATIIST